jgi:endonuclease G
VTGLEDKQSALSLSVAHPDDLFDREIAVIGYPAQDRRNEIRLQNEISGGVFDVKRLQRGKLKERRLLNSFGNQVQAVTQDSSTLGGNSGSAVIDLKTSEVVGLHFAGLYLDANFAVPSYDLARDARVVNAGVKFSDSVEPTDRWEEYWRSTDANESTADPQKTIGKTTVSTSAEPSSLSGASLRVNVGSQ